MYPSLVTVDKRIRIYTEARPAKEFAAIEQQGITKEKGMWKQEKVVQQKSPEVVREVEDDWFILLDVATKKSGRI